MTTEYRNSVPWQSDSITEFTLLPVSRHEKMTTIRTETRTLPCPSVPESMIVFGKLNTMACLAKEQVHE